MEKGFIKRIIQASDDLDTLIYLKSGSFNQAIVYWLKDFSDALEHIVQIYEAFNFKTTASSFNEQRLERQHQEYLMRVVQYIDGVDLIFSRKSLQYAKIAKELHGPKLLTSNVLSNIQEAQEYLQNFKTSLSKINNFSKKMLLYAKENKLIALPKYKYQFTRLTLLESLTLDKAITLLKDKAEI